MRYLPPTTAAFGAVFVPGGIMPAMSRAMLGWPRYAPPTPPTVTLNELERFLLQLFLRRYVTYCVRRRFDAARDAAALFRKITGQ